MKKLLLIFTLALFALGLSGQGIKISAFTEATTAAGSDQLIVNVSGATRRMSKTNLFKEYLPITDTTAMLAPYINRADTAAMLSKYLLITDEGGSTCHAAIVSREMGIPSVIGTKIASDIFKDGDLVEVDANKGIVRKINKR